jgi:hypothetical protein
MPPSRSFPGAKAEMLQTNIGSSMPVIQETFDGFAEGDDSARDVANAGRNRGSAEKARRIGSRTSAQAR